MEIVLALVSQFALIFLKHYNVRVIQSKKKYRAANTTLLTQSAWILSTFIGIKAMFSDDWVVIVAYLAGGYLGSLMSFKMKV